MNNIKRLFRYAMPMALFLIVIMGAFDMGMAQGVSVKTDPINPVQQQKLSDEQGVMATSANSHPPSSVSTESSSLSNNDTQEVSVSNPYGLGALWVGGDIVSRITLLIMAAMSIGSWYIIVTKFLEQNRVLKSEKQIGNTQFWQKKTLKEGIEQLALNSPFRFVVENGVSAVKHHEGALQESIDLFSWTSMAVHRALDKIQSQLQRGLAFLGTVGSTAPFVGLFGTVWGIHHALTAISIAGQATLDKVAGPVGEALIMTAIGLATAVPAVLGYNFLVRRNKIVMDQVRNFAADVETVLIGGNPQNNTTSSNKGNSVS